MNSESEPYIALVKVPESEPRNSGGQLEQLYSYYNELGLFSIGTEGQPLSKEEAQAFKDSLSPEQLERIKELQTAYYESEP